MQWIGEVCALPERYAVPSGPHAVCLPRPCAAMCSSAPACVLSLPQRRGGVSPPVQRGVPTISSEVETLCDQTNASMGNHGHCSMVTGILPAITRTHDIEEGESSRLEPPVPRFQQPSNTLTQSTKSAKSQRMSGWKTSKFFSKTMSSGEILRGLKKLSLTSTNSDPTDVTEQGRPRKSKSGQLKKRSSCGNDDQVNEDDKAKSPRSPGGFRPLSKAMSLSEPGTTGRTTGLGIVCKKEDLKALLCSATSKKFPLASPKKRNRLRQTKSASFEPSEESSIRKEPVRRAGSEETRTKRFEHNESKGMDSASPMEPPEVPVAASVVPAVMDMNAINVTESSSAVCADEPPQDKGTAVKWDECEVVDAVLIGDAIETFLKGSMSTDKRVSFRRQHTDRKTKSDG